MRTARVTIIAAVLALTACSTFADPLTLIPPASIPAPSLRPFADGVNWVLERDLVFHYPGQPDIRVPAGFVTDLASVPAAAQFLRSRVGTYSRAAILHDWLYWTGICPRDQADLIFRRAMETSGSSEMVARQVYLAVSRFGAKAYAQNATERRAGLRRFVPKDDLARLDEKGWEQVRNDLGPTTPPPEMTSPAWCGLGQGEHATHSSLN